MPNEKVTYATAKVQIHRRFWRSMKTLGALRDLRIIGGKKYRSLVAKLKRQHVVWKTNEMDGYPRRRGRPPKPKKKKLICKRAGCENVVTDEGQVYCSPGCAPCGRYFYKI